MTYLDKLQKNRTKREMYQTDIKYNVLETAIEHTRYGANSRNEQQLRYHIVTNHEQVLKIFEATNLPIIHKIKKENMPSAFIIVGTFDFDYNELWLGHNIGIAYQIISEFLFDHNLCNICIYSFKHDIIKSIVPSHDFFPICLIGVGSSHQEIIVNNTTKDTGYYKDNNGTHNLNKLIIETLIIK